MMGIILFLVTFVTALSGTPRDLPRVVENRNPHLYVRTAKQDATLRSLTRVDSLGELYWMDYTADYGLKDLLAMGVKSNTELLGFVSQHLLNLPADARTLSHDFGCSSFLVRTEDGHCLFCRNFDYRFPSPASVITRTKGVIGTFCMNMAFTSATSGSPDDGHTDNSFYLAAPLAMVDGMNKKGLAVSVLVVNSYGAEQHVPGKGNIITTAMIREILDKAKNVDQAVALFDKHNFFAHGESWKRNYHFFIADATGRSVVVEFVNSGRDNRDDKEYRKVVTECSYVTNNFMYPKFRAPLSDTWREAKIKERICAVRTRQDAFQLLLDVNQVYDREKETTIHATQLGPNMYPATLWSLVYDLTDRTAYIITGRELMQGKAPIRVPMK